MSDPPHGGKPPDGEPRVSGAEPLVTGKGEASYAAARCPVCRAPEATVRTLSLDIPYFGEVFETIFLCAACGFKHSDTLLPRHGAPSEFKLAIEGDRDMFVRAVKSSSATVEVPELGLLWEPGPASNSEVTNVEGLLRHFEDAVERAMVLFDTEATSVKGREILGKVAALIEGRGRATLLVKDPYGNSALIDPRGRATRRELGTDEARALRTGEYILEVRGGKPAGVRRNRPAGKEGPR